MGPASCGPYFSWVLKAGSFLPNGGGWQRRVSLDALAGQTGLTGLTSALLGVPRLSAQGPIAGLDSPKGDYRTARPPGALRVSSSDGSRPRGHGKSELGAAAGRAAHADCAAVGLDEALDDIQAETGTAAVLAPAAAAAGLAAPELAEHSGGHVRRDALALVTDGNGDRAGLLPGSLLALWRRRFHHDGRCQRPAGRRVSPG